MVTAIYFRKARDKHSLNSNELSIFFFKQCTIFFSNYLALTKQARPFLVKDFGRFSVLEPVSRKSRNFSGAFRVA